MTKLNIKQLYNRRVWGNISLVVLAAFSLSSCHIYSSYERPENLPTTGLYRDTTNQVGVLVSDTVNFGNMPWRQVFTDSNLQSLIEKALANNTDLKNAEENIEQAQASLKAAKLAYLPSLQLNAQGTLSSFDGGKAVCYDDRESFLRAAAADESLRGYIPACARAVMPLGSFALPLTVTLPACQLPLTYAQPPPETTA